MYLASNYFKHLLFLGLIWSNMTSFECLADGHDAVEVRSANPLRSIKTSRARADAFF